MIFLGWVFILWAAYLAFKHRHNLKNAKKIVIGIVALLFLGIVTISTGKSDDRSAGKEQTSSKVVKHHHAKKHNQASSSSESSTSSSSESESTENSSSKSSNSSSNNDSADSTATSEDDSNSTTTDQSSKGDMTTDQQGTIVGNSKTKVYHTPGQTGYRMNSANAVYFNTEQEAQAAGYRKALR